MRTKKTKAVLKMRHETDYSGYVLGATVGKGKLPRGTKVARVPMKKINAVAALRRELAVLKVRECSERLEKETAQRLLKTKDREVCELRRDIARVKGWLDDDRQARELFDREACAAAGVILRRDDFPTAHRALVQALGEAQVYSARFRVACEDKRREWLRANDMADSLTKLRTAIRTWAESYFKEDDPARAWVLSLLDPVEDRTGTLNMARGTYAAAEGKIA